MRGFRDRSIPPNAFSSSFLEQIGELDEPPNAGEADVAGPWRIEEVPGVGFGLFREGERLARGFRPIAVFADRWLAMVAAAVLPGTGREPLLSLAKDGDSEGYDVVLEDGSAVGHFALFDETLLEGMNAAVHLVRSPGCLAWLLEAAGSVALERCGAILDERVSREAAAGE